MRSALSLIARARHRAAGDINNVSMAPITNDGGEALVEFPGIYQGFNLHSKAYIIMTRRHCSKLEESRKALNSEQTTSWKAMDCNKASQGFECMIPAEKVPFGWVIGCDRDAVKLPFNALVRCQLN